MRRGISLSTLSVGRCFSTPPSDGDGGAGVADSATDASGAGGVSGKAVMARRVMTADCVWKVTAVSEVITAENALGEAREFPAGSVVMEIPRQGFDRMKERA